MMLPYMRLQSEQTYITEEYVSSPPALVIIDDYGAVWTLGLHMAAPTDALKERIRRDGMLLMVSLHLMYYKMGNLLESGLVGLNEEREKLEFFAGVGGNNGQDSHLYKRRIAWQESILFRQRQLH